MSAANASFWELLIAEGCNRLRRKSGVNLALSCSQLSSSVAGTTSSAGDLSRCPACFHSCSIVSTCRVFPSPMSSARQTPRCRRAAHQRNFTPSSWYGRKICCNLDGSLGSWTFCGSANSSSNFFSSPVALICRYSFSSAFCACFPPHFAPASSLNPSVRVTPFVCVSASASFHSCSSAAILSGSACTQSPLIRTRPPLFCSSSLISSSVSVSPLRVTATENCSMEFAPILLFRFTSSDTDTCGRGGCFFHKFTTRTTMLAAVKCSMSRKNMYAS